MQLQAFFIALGLHFPHQSGDAGVAVQKYDATTLAAAVHRRTVRRARHRLHRRLDGDDTLALDESNPLLSPSAPAAARGGVRTFACPRPGNNTVPLWAQRQLRQGYYSAVTHSDWLLGKMVDELSSLGRADDTLVVVTADHGWQPASTPNGNIRTGSSLQVPLLIRAPWLPASGQAHRLVLRAHRPVPHGGVARRHRRGRDRRRRRRLRRVGAARRPRRR